MGPENINIDAPTVGHYRIYVHYFGIINPAVTSTVATVRVYVDMLLRAEYQRPLEANDLWRVAEIRWNSDGTANLTAASSDGGGVGAVVTLMGCTQGFSFGPWN